MKNEQLASKDASPAKKASKSKDCPPLGTKLQRRRRIEELNEERALRKELVDY